MNTYSSKASAKKGASRQGLDVETLSFVEGSDGRWSWEQEAETVVDELDAEMIASYGFAHCPSCGIHLENGVGVHGAPVNGSPVKHTNFVFECLGCGSEFGNKIPSSTPRPDPKATGIKIEKERPEQNGVIRPSVGGKCRAIWDACDRLKEKNIIPTPKEMKAMAEMNGWNANNAVIEMYQWRKFHGITGRQS